MRYYDYNKARQIIESRKDDILSASLGMHEDWFWTGQPIFEGGKFIHELFTGDIQVESEKFNEAARNREANKETIFDVQERFSYILTAGIFGSLWATPVLQLILQDSSDETIECYILKGNEPTPQEVQMQKSIWASGELSQAVQSSITPITK